MKLEIPWDLAFTPEGDIFLTERVGRIRRFTATTLETMVESKDAINAESVPPDTDEQQW